MDFSNQFTKIETDDSLMETVSHGDKAYPFSYYYENLALYDFHCVDWHWHNEFEFVFVESGEVSCDIGSTHFMLHPGQAIMINSKVLHRFQSESDAITPNFLFNPSFISPAESLIYEKYVNPVLSSSLEYVIFQRDTVYIMFQFHTNYRLQNEKYRLRFVSKELTTSNLLLFSVSSQD